MKLWCPLIGFALLGVSLACKVPVFRYALERWEADTYRAVVMYRGGGQAPASLEALVTPLREAEASANLSLEMVDTEALTEAQMWQYDDVEGVGDSPVLRLYYPRETGVESPFWEGALTSENVARVLHSPVRTQLTEAILEGASTTWLLLETGEKARDDEVFARLGELLEQSASELTLPEGVVHADEVSADGTMADGTPLEMDDVLRTAIPLKIDFRVLRLSPSDPEESIFRAMLAGLTPGVPRDGPEEPVAMAVFGRGRALEGLPASKMNAASIQAASAYLCGECSCQVKDQNPGVDLILNVSWEERLEGNLVMLEKPLPPLSGFGVGAVAEPASLPAPASAPASETPDSPTASQTSWLGRVALMALGSLLALAMVGTFLMSRRPSP